MTTKHDAGKPRYDLIPFEALHDMVKVLTFGAEKYGPNNWRTVDDAKSRYFAAAMRHLTAYARNEDVDHESGLPHVAHAMCCLAFLMELDTVPTHD